MSKILSGNSIRKKLKGNLKVVSEHATINCIDSNGNPVVTGDNVLNYNESYSFTPVLDTGYDIESTFINGVQVYNEYDFHYLPTTTSKTVTITINGRTATIPDPAEYFKFINNTISGYIGDNTEVILPRSYSIAGEEILTYNVTSFYSLYNYCRSINNYTFVLSSTYTDEVLEINATSSNITTYNAVITEYVSAYRPVTATFSILNYEDGNDIHVNAVGAAAFQSNSVITSVKILDNIETIGQNAFYNSSTLTEVDLSLNNKSLVKIGRNAFKGTPWHTSLLENNTDTSIYLSRIYYTYNGSIADGKVTIENGTESIAPDAFYNKTDLVEVEVPESVTDIGDYAFYGCKGLITDIRDIVTDNIDNIGTYAFQTSTVSGTLDIPKKIKKIPNSAFGYTKIENVTFHENVEEIADNAFRGNEILEHIELPNSIKTIGENVFEGCTNLKTFKFPDNLETIPVGILQNSSSLESVILPKNCVKVGDYAFSNSNLAGFNLNLPETLQELGSYAFRDSKIKSIYIPKDLVTIGDSAIKGCSNLDYIYVDERNSAYMSVNNCLIDKTTSSIIKGANNSIIPTEDTYTTIANEAFTGLYGIVNLNIPDNIKTIGKAFDAMPNLEYLQLNNNLESVASKAFSDNYNLKSFYYNVKNLNSESDVTSSIINGAGRDSASGALLTIGPDVEVLPGSVFQGSQFTEIDMNYCPNLTTINIGAFSNNSKVKQIQIPESVEVIKDNVFDNCTELESIVIGKNVIELGRFGNCPKLQAISIDADNPIYKVEDNCVIDKNTKELLIGTDLNTLTANSDIESIGDSAFAGCDTMTNLVIPNKVKRIGSNQFDNTSSLRYITIPSTLEYVGHNAFFLSP